MAGRSGKQIGSKTLQGIEFAVADIRAFIFLESEHKEPPGSLIRCNERSGPATLAAAGKANPLLHDTARKVGIDQPATISSTASHKAASVSPDLRIQRWKCRVLNTLFMLVLCHLVA